MNRLAIRPRWFLASVVVHVAFVSCGVAWFAFASVTIKQRPLVRLDLVTEHETVVQEETLIVPIADPTPLADVTFQEVEPRETVPDVTPAAEFERETTEFRGGYEPVPREAPLLRDWLVVIRRPNPEAQPNLVVVVRTRAAPTPIPGQNDPPRYPARASRLGIQGTVTLSVDVDADGLVIWCRIATTSGSRLLDAAALRAVRRWRFHNGPGLILVPVRFTLARLARLAR